MGKKRNEIIYFVKKIIVISPHSSGLIFKSQKTFRALSSGELQVKVFRKKDRRIMNKKFQGSDKKARFREKRALSK